MLKKNTTLIILLFASASLKAQVASNPDTAHLKDTTHVIKEVVVTYQADNTRYFSEYKRERAAGQINRAGAFLFARANAIHHRVF